MPDHSEVGLRPAAAERDPRVETCSRCEVAVARPHRLCEAIGRDSNYRRWDLCDACWADFIRWTEGEYR